MDGLAVDYGSKSRWSNAVTGVSFEIRRGEILGLAGESGSGKSTVGYALLAYLRAGSRIRAGRVTFAGRNILDLPPSELRALRGREIGFVPQNPTTSLSPAMSVGRQVAEVLRFHGIRPPNGVQARVVELLDSVGLPDPAVIAERFPHQLSGGQQQRVVIAMAIACEPSLIILDEPTTGLDVTTQARILRLLADLRTRIGSALLYISHDLGALFSLCDRVGIMYAGELVEIGTSEQLLNGARSPYTRGLMASVPRLDRPPDRRAALKGILRRDALGEGCRFAPRCPSAVDACAAIVQHLETVAPDHSVACSRWRELGASA
ncbi:ABC transporter ATP-binding protein [Kaistia sp. 32K]|uniref:ABC transporter ATP-binding protein n=1 Tax=Kaistia sp. 32K TaxID=2795690 RepID=UPI001FD37287|nr:ABC transporter ATP-binding protein [Kaistia sp. 32K]